MSSMEAARIHTPESSHRWAIILAGGSGTRLLPLTRSLTGDNRPKQFCRLLGEETLLSQTRRRVASLVPHGQSVCVFTQTHQAYYESEVDPYGPTRLLVQPCNRGTAPAILWSALSVELCDPDGIAAFFPSDHFLGPQAVLEHHVEMAFQQARAHPELIYLLGIVPTSAETEYGWIQPGPELSESTYRVACFWEKPPLSAARALMLGGGLWNSFIMIGHVSAFLGLMRRTVPGICQAFAESLTTTGIENAYPALPSVDFSREVLSPSPARLAVLRADELEWSDLGLPHRVLSIAAQKGIAMTAAAQPI